MSLHLPVTFRRLLQRTRALECGLRVKVPAPTFLRLSHAVCGARRALLDGHLRAPSLGGGSSRRRLVEVLAENVPSSKSSLAEMKRFLVEHGIRFERGYTCLILDCPACLFENNAVARHFGSAASFSTPKLYINLNTGTHLCHTCKRSGSWEMFQDLVCLLEKARIHGTGSRKKVALPKAEPGWIPTPQSVSAPKQEYDRGIVVTDKEVSESVADLCTRLGIRNLKLTTLHRYGARISRDLRRLLLPLYYVDGSLLGIHVVSVPRDEADCRPKIDLIPRAVTCMLFGWPQVRQGSRKLEHVVITTSPLDAMAVSQETTIPALSLPNGTRNLPPEALPLLEPFTRVILWLGNDVIAWEASRAFSKKLNAQRCYLIGPKQEHDRPIVALRQGRGTLAAILKAAHPITHSAITSFSAMRDDVLLELSSPEKLAGVKWRRFPQLTRLLKGHRRGELTVFTGPTGSGKTTFISEYSLDLCMQGVCTLWGSFEIINVRLAKIMLTQFAQLPLERHLDRFDDFADRFEQLPLFFMTFHGQQGLKNVLNAMMHAVYVHDIQHVVVDNLQFMMGHEDDAEAHDRFWKQDVIIAAFRRFATAQHCHVTLVIHPRKEKSDELNTSSIFGSAKASQEADNVVILQDKSLSMLRGRKYIQVTKNRFDGDLGVMPLQFDKETLGFSAKKRVKKQIPSDASIRNSSEKVLEIPEN